MINLFHHKNFRKDYEGLRAVSLDPARHEAANAYEHCEMVRSRVLELAELNHLSEVETILLENTAFLHDIGKISGTSNPKASVKIIKDYQIADEKLLNLVKYHDINLPWYRRHLEGRHPDLKDWQRLNRKTDLRLLSLFMIADRVDCPGGWKNNQPLLWFLTEVKERNLLIEPLVLEDNTTV